MILTVFYLTVSIYHDFLIPLFLYGLLIRLSFSVPVRGNGLLTTWLMPPKFMFFNGGLTLLYSCPWAPFHGRCEPQDMELRRPHAEFGRCCSSPPLYWLGRMYLKDRSDLTSLIKLEFSKSTSLIQRVFLHLRCLYLTCRLALILAMAFMQLPGMATARRASELRLLAEWSFWVEALWNQCNRPLFAGHCLPPTLTQPPLSPVAPFLPTWSSRTVCELYSYVRLRASTLP